MDLKSILQTMKKTYTFVVKIAGEVKASDFKDLDVILQVKGMSKRSNPEALNLAALPVDFPRLKDYYGKIYKMTLEFDYPITENQIRTEFCNALCLSSAYVIVRTAESPLEAEEENYLEYKDEDYASVLMDESEDGDINPEDFYGDKYNDELVKMLQSKEAQQYQSHAREVSKKLYNGFN